jgi:hypothetical protein
MAHRLADGVALITAWDGETESWARLALEAKAGDTVDVLGQLSHIAVRLAAAIATTATAEAGEEWTVGRVIQHFAMLAEQEGDDDAE